GLAGAELCLERGAAAVVSAGTPEEVAALPAGKRRARLEATTLEALAEGALFDVVLFHDATALLEPGAPERFRDHLAAGGRLLAVAVNPGSLDLAGPVTEGADYALLVAGLSQAFPSVQVVVQSPLVGYTLVPYGVENPDTAVDGTLAGAVEASHYLFVCGLEPLAIDELSLVALPSRPLLEGRLAAAPGEPPEPDEATQRLRESLAAAEASCAERDSWVAALRRELEERDAALGWREQEARDSAAAATAARREAEAYREDRDHARRQLAARAEELAASLARAKSLDVELRQLRLRDEQARAALDEATAGRASLEARARSAAAAAEEMQRRVSDALARAGRLEEALAATEEHNQRGGALQAQLRAELQAMTARENAAALELQRQSEELTAVESARASLAAEVAARDEKIAQLSAELRTARANAAARLGEVEADLVAVVNAKEGSEAQLAQLRGRLRELERLPAELEERDRRARAATDRLSQELAEALARASQVGAQVDVLRASEASLREQLAAATDRAKHALDDAADAAERAAELERHVEEGRARAARLERDIHTLASAESQGRARTEAAESHVAATVAGLKRLNESLESARADNARLRREADERHAEARREAKSLEEARSLLERAGQTMASERRAARELGEKVGRLEELTRAAQARADHAEAELRQRSDDTGQLRAAHERIEALENELDGERRRLHGSVEQQEILSSGLTQAREAASASGEAKRRALDELAAARDQLEALRQGQEAQRAEADRLRTALAAAESAAAGRDVLTAEVDRLKGELMVAQQQRLQAIRTTGDWGSQAEIGSWKAEAERLQALLDAARTDLATAQRDGQGARETAERAAGLARERDRLEAAVTAAQAELRQMASLPAAMLAQSLPAEATEDVSTSAAENGDELGALRARANDREERLEELRRELADRTDRIARLLSDLGELKRPAGA
ncbi:MAG TPA: hypothetical protein VMB50_11650, partial [Myxococcales bacterium]|nr:hypothetical protein [Myxococcales bacterium]